ncbi:MAG: endopeptidase La [alpha proteobacterium MED-G10]|nr:MAG: endopeptidase La [alpha proteobacterium MED-G10]|tara:strand:- start:153 stop:2555 length:2403 start_codon:yes stop_codon:yes gene_type:complete
MTDFKNPFCVLPLRDIVVFPNMIVPLFVGRTKSIKALEFAEKNDKEIFLVAQRDANVDEPGVEDIYDFGTVATILQLLRLPDGTVKVLVEGIERAKVSHFTDNPDFFEAYLDRISLANYENDRETNALSRTAVSQFENYVKLNRKVPPEILVTLNQITDLNKLADTMSAHLGIKLSEKQNLLETISVRERFSKIIDFMDDEIGVLQVEKKIRSRVKRQMDKTQKEYYLNEQMKAIQKELGESNDGKDEISEIEEKIKKIKFSNEALEKVKSEVKKLRNMGPMSAEATVIRNYIDWMTSIPWNNNSESKINLDKATKVLDEDHYGLDKVKDRIIEYLAVQTRVKKPKGPILCLVGPPGVGKTSLGKSIARALDRPFIKVSLGGMRDESEIRGHRRTYIGSMPGKIIQSLKKSKHSNPLFLLDEVDKIGADWRGDPASALLEVLDPEQNKNFNDHYLEVDYDLSNVMFITTANTLNIPQPLVDRMEVIRISGYTESEKLKIGSKYILPKQIKETGIKPKEVKVADSALQSIIRHYTRESGVRSLEREISKLLRKALKSIIIKKRRSSSISKRNIENYLGVKKFKFGEIESKSLVGVCTGLAWTEVGGELLQIESVIMPGKGKAYYTGKLGDVMKESVQAAQSFVHSNAAKYGILDSLFEKNDIHVHVPEGATPKDGPSAGIAMFTSIISAFTGVPIKNNIAMTGEITLRGRVLPIGGLKEKLLAAVRGGIREVIIPSENKKDLSEITENEILDNIEIHFVDNANEIIKKAFTAKITPFKNVGKKNIEIPEKPLNPKESALTH